jgi:hypothetical protein
MERSSLRPWLRHRRGVAALAQHSNHRRLPHARSLSAVITTRLAQSPAHANLATALPRRFARPLHCQFAAHLEHKRNGHGGAHSSACSVQC